MKATFEDANSTLHTLITAGHTAYLAGGCVRDILLGIKPNDYDVCTSASSEEVQKLFPKTVPVGISFGVVKVLHADNREIDVATFRTDGKYSDNRRPDTVSYTKSAEEDVQRRDFTINALLMDKDGKIIDYVGGQEDLKNRVLRTVGSPVARFTEDALRMMRAIRFAVRYRLDIEENTWNAIKSLSNNTVFNVSKERVTEELTKIFSYGNCSEAYIRLHTSGIWEHWFGSSHIKTYTQKEYWETALNLSSVRAGEEFVLILAILIWSHTEAYQERILKALSLTNAQKQAVLSLRRHVCSIPAYCSLPLAEQRKVLQWNDLSLCLKLAEYEILSPYPKEQVLSKMESVRSLGWPAPMVTGDTLQELGFIPGPVFTVLLDMIRDQQLEGNLTKIEQIKPFIFSKYPSIPHKLDNGQLIDDTKHRKLIAKCPRCNRAMVISVSKNIEGKYLWHHWENKINIGRITPRFCYSVCHYALKAKTKFVEVKE
jgi:tRNA nucleotidyltransferase/poly(A) polymerase